MPRLRSTDEVLTRVRALGRDRPLVILDDDPTGTQTVRGLEVLTTWSVDVLTAELGRSEEALFLLTNSRSLPADRAVELSRSIGETLAAVQRRMGRPMSVVSRSDSTLRGHFPAEVDALSAGLGRGDARLLLAPYFGDGGRITVDDTHLIRRGEAWVPLSETEFARDPTFAYRSSNLREWVIERGAGDREVTSVPLAQLRSAGPAAIEESLAALPAGGICIVNATSEEDIEAVALGALQAEIAGTPVIARTAASYVRARAGQASHDLLTHDELPGGGPGLVVVGSHVGTSTAQLEELLARPGSTTIVPLELDARRLATGGSDAAAQEEQAVGAIEAALARDAVPVVFTSRALVRADAGRRDLDIAARVSAALVRIVSGVERRPAWIIAKGGITSSDLATRSLAVRRATVLGQVLPGVPVWRCGQGSRWPGLTYVVFPGNVGTPDALRHVLELLVAS